MLLLLHGDLHNSRLLLGNGRGFARTREKFTKVGPNSLALGDIVDFHFDAVAQLGRKLWLCLLCQLRAP